MEKKLLWISMDVPYDKVGHAGGKSHNYYLKYVHNSHIFQVKLISFCENKNNVNLDLEKYGINADICYLNHNNLVQKIINTESTLNPYTRYANAISNYRVLKLLSKIKKLKKQDYEPDIVILQWTSIVLLLKYIKKLFPSAKTIAIEEDVMFLSYLRRYESMNNKIKKWFYFQRYKTLKNKELAELNEFDKIFTTNKKDCKLLCENGIKTKLIEVMIPYYDIYNDVTRNFYNINKDIIFYGAMSRPENYLSAKWFIDNVFNKLTDNKVRFIIIGSNPHETLFKYQSDRILITGFVDDITEYLENCLCMVAPLLLGAGIKIKILEGFSSGVPIVTNDVGIEGIEAIDKIHYFHCNNAEDYIKIINSIMNGKIKVKEIANNGRVLVNKNFNYNLYAYKFVDFLETI